MQASGLSHHPELLILAGLLLAACSGAVLLLLPPLLTFSSGLLPKLVFLTVNLNTWLDTGLQALRSELLLLQKSGMLLRILVLSLGVRCCKYLSLYVLLLSLILPLGYLPGDFPLAKVFFGLTAAEMAASLPISGIAGFGAYEGAWSLVFQLLGYPEKLSAPTSISHHLLTQVYGYSLGGTAFLLLLLPRLGNRRQAMIAKETQGSLMFYLRSMLLFLFPLLCTVFVLMTNPSIQQAHSADTGSLSASPTVPAQPPAGKVVF